MDIKIDNSTFVITIEDAKFIFRKDSRSIFAIINSADIDVVVERFFADLMKIENLTINGEPAKPNQLISLPYDLFNRLLADYQEKLKDGMEKRNKELEEAKKDSASD